MKIDNGTGGNRETSTGKPERVDERGRESINFFSELKRRNVLRMTGLYLVGAWLVVQVAGTVLPMFGAPDWLPRTIVVLLAIGFVPAVIFSWVFELTAEGLKREQEVAPEQSITPQTGRRMDRMIIVVLVLALGYFAFDKFVLAPRRSFGEGLLARMIKDEARARTAFEAARAQQEKIVQAQPDYGPALCVLGLIDAALGRKDLALDEGRRAIALTPLEKDVANGSLVLQYFAITAAWAGDKELALQQLETGLRAPAASLMLSYGALKLFPFWDLLRGDPRFEKIVQSLAPKEEAKR
jgi:tetratricopeptide (TPR) repeat protein